MASVTRLDVDIDNFDLDTALFISERLFHSYLSILRATLGYYGSSDGKDLSCFICDATIDNNEFRDKRGMPFCEGEQDNYLAWYRKIAKLFGNQEKPMISNFMMIDDWVIYEKVFLKSDKSWRMLLSRGMVPIEGGSHVQQEASSQQDASAPS